LITPEAFGAAVSEIRFCLPNPRTFEYFSQSFAKRWPLSSDALLIVFDSFEGFFDGAFDGSQGAQKRTAGTSIFIVT
jgi:hypothetical protein